MSVSKTWARSSPGFFDDATNWNPGSVPAADNDINIANGNFITAGNVFQTIKSDTVATINISGNPNSSAAATLSGNFTCSAITTAPTGHLLVQNGTFVLSNTVGTSLGSFDVVQIGGQYSEDTNGNLFFAADTSQVQLIGGTLFATSFSVMGTSALSITSGADVEVSGSAVIDQSNISSSNVVTVSGVNTKIVIGSDSQAADLSLDGSAAIIDSARMLVFGDVTVTTSGADSTAVLAVGLPGQGNGAVFASVSMTVSGQVATATNQNGDPNGTAGDWTYSGGLGAFFVGQNATALAGTLNLEANSNASENGVSVDPLGRLFIGSPPNGLNSGTDNIIISPGGLLIGHGTVTAATLDNDGNITAQDGVLFLESNTIESIGGSGLATIDHNSTLDLGGAFVSGTISFLDGTGALVLDQPSSFSGLITTLVDGDTIILKGLSVNAAAKIGVLSAVIVDPDGNAPALDILEGKADSSSLTHQLYHISGAQSLSDFEFSILDDGTNTSLTLKLRLDVGMPVVSSINTSQSTEADAGTTVKLTLAMSEGLTVAGGPPTLTLNDSAIATFDLAASNLATGLLVFDYTVGSKDHTSNLAITQVNLNGAVVQDAGGHNADFSGALNVSTGLQIGPSPPNVSSINALTDTGSSHVNASHLVTITLTTSAAVTVTGTPTLQLSDGEVAAYTIGSGSSTLTFTYVVQPGDNAQDLHVTGLNLPNGSSIQDGNGNPLSGPVSGDLGINVDTTTVVPTTVETEIMGLYAALYNRAGEAGGYTFWVSQVAAQADAAGLTVGNSSTTAVTAHDAQVLGQGFVISQSTFFNATYGGLTDSAFINAMYVNIGGNAGDPGGLQFWSGLLQSAETGGQSVQDARAGLVGRFVQILSGFDTNNRPAGLTDQQWTDAIHRTQTIDNKIATSIGYFLASQQPDGALLNPAAVNDPAYLAAIRAIQGVTSDPLTAEQAISNIAHAVAAHDLNLIQPVGVTHDGLVG